jgi:2-keto-3-deoxy-L-rhamnonate aldolase RhmA
MDPQKPFVNPLKQMLKQGKKTAGSWLHMGSPIASEIVGRAGFDWVIIDMEHGPGDIMTLISQLQAISGGNDPGDQQRHQLMRTLQEAVEQQVIHEGPPRPCSITHHMVTTWQPGRRT